jgi:Tfp pilus assembly protein PilN
MINLIPASAKKKLLKAYWSRVFTVWFLVWTTALLVGISLVIPTWVLISTQVAGFIKTASSTTQNIVEFEQAQADITRANKQAFFLLEENNSLKMSERLNLFYDLRGEGVQINEIKINREGINIKSAIVSGTAESRQALSDYRNRLLESKFITEAQLPISNLAQDKDIKFSLTINIAPPNSEDK